MLWKPSDTAVLSNYIIYQILEEAGRLLNFFIKILFIAFQGFRRVLFHFCRRRDQCLVMRLREARIWQP